MRSSITISVLALAPYMTEAQKSTTKYSTSTIFLPPRSTGSYTNIYASLITETGSKTEYVLACETNVEKVKSCGGDFTGITVTYEKSSMRAAFDSTTYDCSLGSNSAVCATITASATSETGKILPSESSSWMTPVTFIDVKKRKATSTKSDQPAETGSSGHCKRAVSPPTINKRKVGHGSSSSDSDSSSSGSDDSSGTGKAAKAGAGGGASDASNNANPKKKTDHDCSSGSIASWSWGALALGFSGYLGLNLA